jgi:hypothetical protein
MKIRLFLMLTLLANAGFSPPVFAAEYIYRDLMANTLPSAACAIETEAVAQAAKEYNLIRYSKRFCQAQGYGWHVVEIKAKGKPVCQDCAGTDSGKKQCHLEDVVVSCKRIKPGSVGMLPGKG